MLTTILLFIFFGSFLGLFLLLKSRNIDIWILPYLKQKIFYKRESHDNIDVYFCLADHFEPYFGNAEEDEARELVSQWVLEYKKVAIKHTDSNGRHPQHSYFYPIEEYDEHIIEKLKGICTDGLGDVDIHLHHDNDTAANLKKTLDDFKNLLSNKHGLLRKDKNGNIVYGFIHGNWALDNSRPDGRWCGVDNEIDVLLDTGCVFDMTMPSAPSDTQTSIINSIYFAKDDGKCKSHNTGVLAKVNEWRENELLMIQGPLELNWKHRKLGLIPKIESGELSYDAPPLCDRVDLWKSAAISVNGAENKLFIKLYTHGLQEKNMKMFFQMGGFETLWTSLENQFKNSDKYSLHYVTAWEMYEKIKSLIQENKST